MDKPMGNWDFRFMSFSYIFRDFFLPRENILAEVGIKQGYTILDYGCGSGSYTIPAARLVGESGKIYALDIHPLAVRRVQKIVVKKKLANIITILSDCATCSGYTPPRCSASSENCRKEEISQYHNYSL